MRRIDISKILFYLVSMSAVLGLSFGFGLYSGARKTIIYDVVSELKTTVESAISTVKEEASTLTKIHPKHFLQPAYYKGSGVTVNNNTPGGEEELVFLSGFFEDTNELRLIRRNGDLIARWPVRFSEIFPDTSHITKPPVTDWNIDIHGALMLPDGSVVFNLEYGGLVKLDRCGDIVWTLARQSHHSVELAERGGFWVPGRRHYPKGSDSPFPPFQTPLNEDTIMKISEDGKVLAEISVPKLLFENGLEALLTSTGNKFSKTDGDWTTEIVHLNKVEVLTSDIADDFPMFEAGDLALSFRDYNLVIVVDPDTLKVKWWKIGPWLRQHDPEFMPGGKLVVFNNNNYLTAFGDSDSQVVSPESVSRLSNIIEIDPASNKHKIVYGGESGQRVFSVIRGKHERTPTGDLLVTEFEGGRVFEIDVSGRIVWEYINRYSSAEVAEARVYSASYFNVSDWSCEKPNRQ